MQNSTRICIIRVFFKYVLPDYSDNTKKALEYDSKYPEPKNIRVQISNQDDHDDDLSKGSLVARGGKKLMEEIEAHQLHHLSLHLLGYQLDTKDD